MFNAQLIICGDFETSTEKFDATSEVIAECLYKAGIALSSTLSCPKSREALEEIVSSALENKPDLLVIAGGTGLGQGNFTPQVVARYSDYEIPGFGELIRQKSMGFSENALLGRGGAWVKNRILILALAGNKQAVRQQYEALGGLVNQAITALNNQCSNRRPIVKAKESK